MGSNTGVNAGFAKCFILFMAIVILLQGVVYLGLAVWGITMRNCSNEVSDFTAKPFQFVMDLVYFLDEQCGNPKISLPGETTTVNLEVDWTVSYYITNREYIFMITYAVISGLWVISSLLVIATICGPVTKIVSALCFWPWFLFVIAGSILDAVATGFHVHDITQTMSSAEAFQYVGLINVPEIVVSALSSFDAYFITPAVVMTCISCRVVLIWLLNIFGCSFCLSLSRVLLQRNSKENKRSNTSTPSTAIIEQTEITAQFTQTPQQQHLQQQAQQLQQQQQQEPNFDSYPQQIRPKPLPIQNATIDQRSSYSPQHQQQAQYVYPNLQPIASAPIPDDNNPRSPNDLNRSTSVVVEATTYRSTDTHPDRLNYPPPQISPPLRPVSPSPQLSLISPLNNRYSSIEQQQQQHLSTNPNTNSTQIVSAELRSQLPWSYTSAPGSKPQPPRKPQQLPQQQQQQQQQPIEVYPALTEERPQSNQYSRW